MEYGERSFGRPREMHKIVCSDCGNEGEVPFRPNGTRPVYCRDCYAKRRPRRY
jgi:CxxC-x17-CxxC domain-containing protein